MRSIDISEIDVNGICVACYNADAFAVEGESLADVMYTLNNSCWCDILDESDVDFEDWAKKLDFHGGAMPRKIYVVDDNRLAFVMFEDNPYFD